MPPSGKGDEEVDDLDSRFEHVDRGVLFEEGGRLPVDGHGVLRVHGTEAVDRSADDVEYPAQAFGPDGHADRTAQVLRLHPSDQAVGDIHRDAADDVVAQMLGDLHDQVVLLIVDGGIGDGDGVHDVRELSFLERQIDDRPDDLYYLSDVHTRLLQMIEWAHDSPLQASHLFPFNLSPGPRSRPRYPSVRR